MEEKLNLKLKKSSDLIGELPRPEEQGFQRLAGALRLQPHLLVRGKAHLSPSHTSH